MMLSKKQQEIVNASDKYLYVLAGAGSGKTRTLSERIKTLISKNKQGEKVLAITFSNKAANELKDRLLNSYSEQQLSEYIYIGTIHNFCMEIVLQRSASIGLNSELHIFESEQDRLSIFKDAVGSIPQLKKKTLSNSQDNEKWIKESYYALSKAKRNLMFPSDYNQKPISKLLYQEYQNLMLAQNAIDFDDILLYAYRILAEKESISRIYQRIYKYICVDEAQDLNKAQYELIKILAGTTSCICMVGDPNQAIYGFNGSSSEYMCKEFPKEFNAKEYTLTENYRSSKSVLEAAKILEPDFEIVGQIPIQGDFLVKMNDDENTEAKWVIEKLKELLKNGHPDVEGGKIEIHQCAVLGRNRYVFSVLEKLLKENNIDYTLRVSANQILNSESNVFKIFDLGLRLLVNLSDKLHLSVLLSIFNSNESEIPNIESFSELRNSPFFGCKLGKQTSDLLNDAWNILSQNSNSIRFERILEKFKIYCEKYSNFNNDEERFLVFNDYQAWIERWETYCRKTSVEERSISDLMRSIALDITNISDDNGLILSTVHMAKGLEFDVVFIMGLNEGTFPDYRTLNSPEQLNEEKHNMFVSITRSKRLCYLSFPLEKVMPWGGKKTQLPSRFIDVSWM